MHSLVYPLSSDGGGQPIVTAFSIQLEEARAEWRWRNPKMAEANPLGLERCSVKQNDDDTILTTFERSLMRAFRLKDVRELDEMFAAPTSEWAESHSRPPDEEYELVERMYAEQDRQLEAQERFNALVESDYLN